MVIIRKKNTRESLSFNGHHKGVKGFANVLGGLCEEEKTSKKKRTRKSVQFRTMVGKDLTLRGVTPR